MEFSEVLIIDDRDDICLICEKPFKHIKINRKLCVNGLCETRFVTTHGKCRSIVKKYEEARENYYNLFK